MIFGEGIFHSAHFLIFLLKNNLNLYKVFSISAGRFS